MKNNFINVSFLFLLIISCSTKYNVDFSQGLDVFHVDNEYIIKGKIDQKKYYSGLDASEAIQYALDKVSEFESEVFIYPGSYVLNKQIDVPSHTSLAGSGNSTKLIFSSDHNTGTAISCKDAGKVSIKNLFIKTEKSNDSAEVGIVLDNCGDTFVENVSCNGLQDYGIVLSGNSFLCEIRGCKLSGIDGSGIYLKDLKVNGRGGDFVPNLVTNCIIYRCGQGIELKNAKCNNLVACIVYQTKSHAFYLHTLSNANIISACRTMQIEDDAVKIENSHEININGNNIAWHDGNGIVLEEVTWGTISDNNIIDTGNVPFENVKTENRVYWKTKPDDYTPFQKNAIIMEKCKGLTVSGNAIFNWASNPPLIYGIYESKSSQNNLITSNNINNFTKNGVKSDGTNSMAVNNMEVKDAHKGKGSEFHSFDPRVIEEFIDGLY